MKKKHFYSHLIETNTLITELDKLEMDRHEKAHLSDLIDSNIHHAILEAILSELSQKEKKVFVDNLTSEEHEKVMEHLKRNIDRIEEKIVKTADDLKDELQEDIKKARARSSS